MVQHKGKAELQAVIAALQYRWLMPPPQMMSVQVFFCIRFRAMVRGWRKFLKSFDLKILRPEDTITPDSVSLLRPNPTEKELNESKSRAMKPKEIKVSEPKPKESAKPGPILPQFYSDLIISGVSDSLKIPLENARGTQRSAAHQDWNRFFGTNLEVSFRIRWEFRREPGMPRGRGHPKSNVSETSARLEATLEVIVLDV
ncbi:MAG: hypothetical protein MMC33_002250 [Icmadophila ericetorum]|nr:hypothetical protein [Icmadophila ericetorum]